MYPYKDLGAKQKETSETIDEINSSIHDPARIVLYALRKNETKAMIMYGTGDVKLVVGWISSGNTAKILRSNKCVDVNTPLNNNRGDPTLWSKEMPGNLESLVSSFVITNPSIEPGTRIVFVKPNGKKEGNCVQVLTVMNLSPIVGTVRIARIELQVANSHFGGDWGLPYPSSTELVQFNERNELKFDDLQKVGVDHALVLFFEGEFFWDKRGEDLFAGCVRDSTDSLFPLCLFSKVDESDCFGDCFSEKIDLNSRVLGDSLFQVCTL